MRLNIKAGVKQMNCLVGRTKQSQSVFNDDSAETIACCEAKLHRRARKDRRGIFKVIFALFAKTLV